VTGTGAAASLAEMLDERRHLLEIATWMFGAATADEIVQETYRRWYTLDDDERQTIAVARAWLTRVAGGICLDLLSSTAAAETPERRGPVVPSDPVRGPALHQTPDPVTAWLQRHPQQDQADRALLARHDQVARRFAAACVTEDAATLKAVLAADAMVVSDGGGKVRAAADPTHGADAVAHFVTALLAGRPRTVMTVESVNGRTGLVLRSAGQAVAVVSVSVADGEVTAVWIVLNPDKLQRWQRP
jgi:RNA polymerase sigma-70 factor (ECF subfamily)